MVHEAQNKPILDVLHRSKEQSFAFDKIFSTETHETVTTISDKQNLNVSLRFIMKHAKI